MDRAGPEEMEAEVRVTLANWDVSEKEKETHMRKINQQGCAVIR